MADGMWTRYTGFAQLAGLLLIAVILVFVWNRKLSKLNESLNAEVAGRRRMESVHKVLNRIVLAVTGVSGIDEFYSIVHAQINSLMPARNMFIAFHDKETGLVSYPYFADENSSPPLPHKMGNGLVDHVIKSGTPLFMNRRLNPDSIQDENEAKTACWIGAPLKQKGESVGVIAVRTYDHGKRLGNADLEVLVFISYYVGLTLERLRLLEERKNQTHALKDSEERFRSLFEDSAEATLLLENMTITGCNTAAYKLMGMDSKKEIIGRSPTEFSPEIQPDGTTSAAQIIRIREEIKKNGGARFEWTMTPKEGLKFPAEILITPIACSGRHILHMVIRDITSRKSREEAILEREIKYRALFDYASDAIILFDCRHCLVSANPEAVSMFRCESEKDILSCSPDSIMPQEQPGGVPSLPLFRNRMRAALETGSLDFETVCSRLDGEIFQASVRVRKLVVNGEIILQCTINDITEQKRAREKIERSVSLLTATIESSADGILAVDAEGRIAAWNSRLASMWNLSEFDLNLGNTTNIYTLIENQLAEASSGFREIWTGTQDVETGHPEEMFLTDGRIIERYSNPQRIGRDIVGRVWSFRDVTERRRAEKALRASHRRLNDIIEFLPDPTIVIDTEGTVVAWNKAIEEVTGVSKEEILGKGDYEYALPFYNERRPILADCALNDFRDIPSEIYDSVEIKGSALYGEIYTPSAFGGDGAYFWGVAGPLKDETGKVVGAIECMRDVTERRRVEQALHKAKIEAEVTTRTKSEFLANMSHEIRTPMNSIIGFGNLLSNTSLDGSQEEFLEKLLSSADSLLSIIDDILDFSKIEAGKIVLEQVEFDLDDVLEKICNMLIMKAENKGIDFVLAVDANVPHRICGDPLRLEQILTNLVSNAVKFTTRGEVALTVSATEKTNGKAAVQFNIKDTGIGLNPDKVDNLFKPFTQADASITRKYGGTGLGLAITHSLVSRMGGDMRVESEPGKGSCFSFSLDFSVVENTAAFQLPEQTSVQQVLISGTNPLMLQFISATLENMSCKTVRGSSLQDIVGALRESLESGKGFDLIFIDFRNDDLQGLETLSAIRQSAGCENIPVIGLLPVNCDEDMRQKAFDLGAEAFITKPVTRCNLYESLSGSLPVDSPEKKPVAAPAPLPPTVGKTDTLALLVEDNELNQQVAKRMIEKFGIGVDVAANGREALNALRDKAYDIVFMDIQMPEMDGLTATRLIRADKRYETLPIIAMTAHVMPGDRKKSLDAGMAEHLTKPIKAEELERVLNRFLTGTSPYVPEHDVSKVSDDFLPELPGLDCEEGLKNIGGSRKGYERVLMGFRADYGTASTRTAELIESGRFKEAAALLHKMKGIAGNIGATRLYDICRILECDIQEENINAIRSDFELFSSELQLIIDGLGGMKNIFNYGDVKNNPDIDKISDTVRSLYEMLREGNAESCDMLDQLKYHFAPGLNKHLLDRLTGNILNYDFDEACTVLETLSAELEIGLT